MPKINRRVAWANLFARATCEQHRMGGMGKRQLARAAALWEGSRESVTTDDSPRWDSAQATQKH
jgi:hypothetical protein